VIAAIDKDQPEDAVQLRVIEPVNRAADIESYRLDPISRGRCRLETRNRRVVAAGNWGRNGLATITSPGEQSERILSRRNETRARRTVTNDLIASYRLGVRLGSTSK